MESYQQRHRRALPRWLLTLPLLYHFDYVVGRFISLERIFEESKERYYETLEASSQGWHEGAHDIALWLDYFWGVLLRACKEFEERVGISRDMVRVVLRAMKAEGLIRPTWSQA